MGTRHMSGTPWHIGYGSNGCEGERRRHKSRCKFFRKGNQCLAYSSKCMGSGRCSRYSERNKIEQEIYDKFHKKGKYRNNRTPKEEARRKSLFYKEATPYVHQSVFDSPKKQRSKKKENKEKH